jgi:hypothetical protein
VLEDPDRSTRRRLRIVAGAFGVLVPLGMVSGAALAGASTGPGRPPTTPPTRPAPRIPAATARTTVATPVLRTAPAATVAAPAATVAAPAPTSVTGVQSGPNAVTLRWNGSDGGVVPNRGNGWRDPLPEVVYRVYRDNTFVGSSTTPEYTDGGVPQRGFGYAYQVTATLVDGTESPRSAPIEVTVRPADTTPPNAPTGVTVSQSGNDQVTVAWNATWDNVGVSVYRVSRDGVDIGATNARTLVDTGVLLGTSVYRVVAVDGAGNTGAASVAVSITMADRESPRAVTGLRRARTDDPTTVALAWNPASDNVGVVSYQLCRSDVGCGLATTPTPAFQDTGLAPGTYTYLVKARDAAGNGSISAPFTVTVTGG